jgi:protein-S-isoprenylcysteine O-methyltransferase Ste14
MGDVSRALVQLLVVATWLLIIPAFVRRKSKASEVTRRRDSVSRLGIIVQAVAFSLSWAGPWWAFMHTTRPQRMPLWAAVVAVALGLGGALLVAKSIRTLGREWSLTARVIEGHRLVTSGPYAVVRNPIYTGMWGLQLATAIAFSAWLWWGLVPVAAAIYYLGTVMRVRREEKLLREEFGAEFDEYARRVPAIVPWTFGADRRRDSRAKA